MKISGQRLFLDQALEIGAFGATPQTVSWSCFHVPIGRSRRNLFARSLTYWYRATMAELCNLRLLSDTATDLVTEGGSLAVKFD